MSFRSVHVVVPYAVFNERRERRTRVSAALREHDRSDVDLQSPVAVAVTVAHVQARSAATRGQASLVATATEECE